MEMLYNVCRKVEGENSLENMGKTNQNRVAEWNLLVTAAQRNPNHSLLLLCA